MIRLVFLTIGIIVSGSLQAGAPTSESSTAGKVPEESRPSGRFLFQPMLIWGTGEVTHQGTGYLVEHKNKIYGVTSVHFLNFEAKGLFEAIWTDIYNSEPVLGFKKSVGRPTLTEIDRYIDIQHDFVVMPAEELPNRCAKLKLDSTGEYRSGMRLWFPNKAPNQEIGYEWVEAELLKDEGHMIRVKLLSEVKMQSQSGSPFLRKDTGAVIGMLMGGEEKEGVTEIFLCPARGIVRHLAEDHPEQPLLRSIVKK